ncbi:unnamed protein product [Zymoseptoria tritici ST99CH_1A5]|uniref:Uncharacterized protein n=1 Tax=Zymoseptoria tritici ST99CH_1A5 TaxID=1276529 RepID=A0A1Y6M1C8_ZYMTR|nr:unnamed protein product [Zymoseptoria tritici ST99CH_1A5]
MSEPFLQITIFPASRHTSDRPHAVPPIAAPSSPSLPAPISSASNASTSSPASAVRSTASLQSASSAPSTVLSSSTPGTQTHNSPNPSEASSLSSWGTALVQTVGARFAALRSGLTWPGAGRGDPISSGSRNHPQACLRDSHGASPNQIALGWASPLSPCYCDLCVKLAREREREREIAELPCGTPTNIDEAKESVTATFISLYESQNQEEVTAAHEHAIDGEREEQQLASPAASESSTHGGAAASPDSQQPSQQDRDNEIIATQDHLITQLYVAVADRDHLITLQARQLDHYEAYAHGRRRHSSHREVIPPPQRPNTPSSTSTSPSSPSAMSSSPSYHTHLASESSYAIATQSNEHPGSTISSPHQLGSDRLAAHRGSVMEAGVELDRTVVGGVEILQSGRGVRVWRRGG